MSDRCTLSPDCELGQHEPDAHPCGKSIHAGDPCHYCGDPILGDEDGHLIPCPRCWKPATIADFKALMAEVGYDTVLGMSGGGDHGD